MERIVRALAMSKHEGAGNDFLVMIDLEDRVQLTDDEVRFLADRHRGIGADGVITVSAGTGGGDVTMALRNQDGSFAETSGNGLRCMAHEVVRAGVVAAGRFTVMTGAGLRQVTCREPDGIRAWTSASMGELEVIEMSPSESRAVISVGNPHLVIVVDDLSDVDVVGQGAALQESHPGGINVEWVALSGHDHLGLVVFERGVGPTLACGSGSCAAALAARELGLSGSSVVIDNPGGPLEVSLEGNRATLSGEVRLVADLFVPLERMQ